MESNSTLPSVLAPSITQSFGIRIRSPYSRIRQDLDCMWSARSVQATMRTSYWIACWIEFRMCLPPALHRSSVSIWR